MLLIVCGCVLLGCQVALAQPATQSEPTAEQLKKWLEQYPQADANRDGVLTREEAEAYRRRCTSSGAVRRRPATRNSGRSSRTPRCPMACGSRWPWLIPASLTRAATSRQWPAMLEMHGYPDSTVPRSPGDFGDQYVTVRVSLRGAGASEGTIQAISHRNGLDGHEVIENWIVQQPWSNGKVALHGHSWGGLSAFMIAATNPPHLTAVAVSGLLDDIYRDIGRIGGVRNAGFPVEWMVNLYKPTGPFDSSEAARQARGLSAEEYQELLSARPPWDLEHDVLWNSLTSSRRRPEFAAASPGTFASGVRARFTSCTRIRTNRRGPAACGSGSTLRTTCRSGWCCPMAITVTWAASVANVWNGSTTGHCATGRGSPQEFSDPARRVQVYFDTPRKSQSVNPPLVAADFPLPQTAWTRYYFRAGQQLSTQPPPADESGEDAYSVAVGRPDADMEGVHYLLAFDKPTALCGPIGVTFWATCTTVDTDFYVAVADVDAQGVVQLLQRGLLRGSHARSRRGEIAERRDRWSGDVGATPAHPSRHASAGARPARTVSMSKCFPWGTCFVRDTNWRCGSASRRWVIRSRDITTAGRRTCMSRRCRRARCGFCAVSEYPSQRRLAAAARTAADRRCGNPGG